MQKQLEFQSTSKEAYDKFISEGKKDKHHRLILSALKNGEMTSYEIGKAIGISSVAVSRRTSELERMELIERTGERKKDADGSKRMIYRLI